VNFTTQTLRQSPARLTGIFDCLNTPPLDALQLALDPDAFTTCSPPAGTGYQFALQQIVSGLLSDQTQDTETGWIGRFKVWAALFTDAPFYFGVNAPGSNCDLNLVPVSALPSMTFWLKNNNTVSEKISVFPSVIPISNSPNFPLQPFTSGNFSADPTPQFGGVGGNQFGGITVLENTLSYIDGPGGSGFAAPTSQFVKARLSVHFFENPQDCVCKYGPTPTVFYYDSKPSAVKYGTPRNTKLIYTEYNSGAVKTSSVTAVRGVEFVGAFNSLRITRGRVKELGSPPFNWVPFTNPCGQFKGYFPNYFGGGVTAPEIMFLAYHVQYYPPEL